VPSVLKSWSLNLLENSDPFQAGNAIALTLPFTEEKGCVASVALPSRQIPDQCCSQFDTKSFKWKAKLQTRRRSGDRNEEVESLRPKFDVPCIKPWDPSPHNDD